MNGRKGTKKAFLQSTNLKYKKNEGNRKLLLDYHSNNAEWPADDVQVQGSLKRKGVFA